MAAAEAASSAGSGDAWIAAGAAVVVALVSLVGVALQQRSSVRSARRIGTPVGQDGRESTVADQLMVLTGHVLHLAESHVAVEQRVDAIELVQARCGSCPRAIGVGVAGS